MKQKNYRSLIYFIAATIVATIAIQLYWNIQNYRINRQRLINEVQISLDNGVEAYYSDLAKTDIFAFVGRDTIMGHIPSNLNTFWSTIEGDSTFLEIESDSDSVRVVTGLQGFAKIIDSGGEIASIKPKKLSAVSVFQDKNQVDSVDALRGLTSKIIVSITRDSMNFEKLDTLFTRELERKDINISYIIKHFDNDSLLSSSKGSDENHLELSTLSKSTYLPDSQKLQLFFSNPTLAILKRSLTGISLSFLLSACIIGCLLYLLHIINKQKELAEIKNDLISNITHEFKTPIATVFTAIEGIKNFNEANDREKTNNYLDISHQQLNKLNQMVEKLLETATLDSDKLLLGKEEVNLVFLLQNMVEKYQVLSTEKKILFKANIAELVIGVDPFHFENAIANLLDNAIKYGGDTIEVNLNSQLGNVEITVADNGRAIDKSQGEKIFDKFYRIPTGNRHDVKGFGIGLFYTKKIVEKHNGRIELVPGTKNTIFKITL